MSKKLGERTWDVPNPRTEDVSEIGSSVEGHAPSPAPMGDDGHGAAIPVAGTQAPPPDLDAPARERGLEIEESHIPGERTWDVPNPRTEDVQSDLDALIERLREDRDPCEEADLMHEAAQALTALRTDVKAMRINLLNVMRAAEKQEASLKAELKMAREELGYPALKAENARQAAEISLPKSKAS